MTDHGLVGPGPTRPTPGYATVAYGCESDTIVTNYELSKLGKNFTLRVLSYCVIQQ